MPHYAPYIVRYDLYAPIVGLKYINKIGECFYTPFTSVWRRG